MKKLTLNVEELEVSSFEIPVADEDGGTVHGHVMTDSGVWYCLGTWVCSVRCAPEIDQTDL